MHIIKSKDLWMHIALYFVLYNKRVRSAFSLVAGCVLLKYTRMDDVN